MNLFLVNHHIRQEATYILYGLNTFGFVDVGSIIPFMRDRTPQTSHCINSVQFFIRLDIENFWGTVFANARLQTWQQALENLAKIPQLNFREVVIEIRDLVLRGATEDLPLQSPELGCLHSLRHINGLETLGVRYKFYPHTTDRENQIWSFLAPAMLAIEDGKAQDAESLKCRRSLGEVSVSPYLSSPALRYTNVIESGPVIDDQKHRSNSNKFQ